MAEDAAEELKKMFGKNSVVGNKRFFLPLAMVLLTHSRDRKINKKNTRRRKGASYRSRRLQRKNSIYLRPLDLY